MRARRPPVDGGFTMFEMLIVLAILGMMMTVAPSIMRGLDGFRLRAASDEMVNELRQTRSEALRRGAPTELVLDLANLSYAVSTAPGMYPLPAVIDAVDVGPAARVEPGRLARVRFLADGTATSLRITLRNGGRSVVIVVDWLTGSVHGTV